MPDRANNERTEDRETQRDSFLENYLRVQYAFVQFLSEHLVDCRKSIGGDLDDIMLLAVLGQRMMASRLDEDRGKADSRDRKWMSALRIAEVTGIPRESVRRKLVGLAEKGWVANSPDQGWSLATTEGVAKVRDDLAGLDNRGLDRLARLFSAIQRVLNANPVDRTVPGAQPEPQVVPPRVA
jgi:hypothetical protein